MLLDIKVKEPNLEAMARGRIVYEPPRFMTVAQCASQMLETEEIIYIRRAFNILLYIFIAIFNIYRSILRRLLVLVKSDLS